MDCRLAANLLGDYLDEVLSLELKDRLERHLLACRECAWQAQSLRITLSALRTGSDLGAPREGFRERLLSQLLREQQAAIADEGWPEPALRPAVIFVLPGKEQQHVRS